MKKQLNVDLIQSELRGGSAFFPGYKGESSPPPLAKEPDTTDGETQAISPIPKQGGEPEPVRVPVPPPVPLVPKAKRLMKQRQPFDIYEDQYQRLKKIAEAEKDFVNGRGMSQMVREAIDNYLRDHGSPEK